MPFNVYNEQVEWKTSRVQTLQRHSFEVLRESTRGPRAESVDVLNDSLESWNSNLCFASGLIG